MSRWRSWIAVAVALAFSAAICLIVYLKPDPLQRLKDERDGLRRQVREMRVRLEVTREVCQQVIELGITTIDGRRP